MHLRRLIIKEIKRFIHLLKQDAALPELEQTREKIRRMKKTLEEQDALDKGTSIEGQL